MIVCSCTGSTDRDVQRAMDAGASSLDAIGDSCSAGSLCGGCHSSLSALLRLRSCETCPHRSAFESESAHYSPGREN
jgi:bacterioferritin-associated ferredoxin